MRTCVTTIVSANYLAYAKVLGKSVRDHYPDAEFRVLVVDRRTADTEAATHDLPFSIVWAEELGLPDFERIAYQFDILELNTGLKPTLLKKILLEGFEAVIYFDPDIRLFTRPTPVLEALSKASVVLTPHALAPMMDGQRPSDIDIMRSGIYNLGFVAVRHDAVGISVLNWWEELCLSLGYNDAASGIFVDQKWMDLAPCYFDSVLALKHRGCNVAYWNLHERRVTRTERGLQAGNDELVFFHFSGVNAKLPGQLSKYQTRHSLEAEPVLRTLVQDYCDALVAERHLDYLPISYTFGRLSDGRPITPVMRRALGVIGDGELSPFDATSPLQRRLAKAGIAPRKAEMPAARPEAKINALNFDHTQGIVVLVNKLLRLSCKLLGVDRMQQLLRYLSFLTRGANLAAVLTDAPFVLNHPLQPRSPASHSRSATDAHPALESRSQ